MDNAHLREQVLFIENSNAPEIICQRATAALVLGAFPLGHPARQLAAGCPKIMELMQPPLDDNERIKTRLDVYRNNDRGGATVAAIADALWREYFGRGGNSLSARQERVEMRTRTLVSRSVRRGRGGMIHVPTYEERR